MHDKGSFPPNTWRNDNVFITLKRRHFGVIDVKWAQVEWLLEHRHGWLVKHSLRIIHNDYEASFETLLKCSKQESLLTKRLKIMILEVFKTVNRLNPSCLHDMFTKNEVVYDLRTQKLEQPKRRTTTYGLRTFSYLGSKLWNLLASEYSEVNTEALKGHRVVWKIEMCYLIRMT